MPKSKKPQADTEPTEQEMLFAGGLAYYALMESEEEKYSPEPFDAKTFAKRLANGRNHFATEIFMLENPSFQEDFRKELDAICRVKFETVTRNLKGHDGIEFHTEDHKIVISQFIGNCGVTTFTCTKDHNLKKIPQKAKIVYLDSGGGTGRANLDLRGKKEGLEFFGFSMTSQLNRDDDLTAWVFF